MPEIQQYSRQNSIIYIKNVIDNFPGNRYPYSSKDSLFWPESEHMKYLIKIGYFINLPKNKQVMTTKTIDFSTLIF